MARIPTDENRKVQLGLTVKKWIKELLEKAAIEDETSMSRIVEMAVIEKFTRDKKI